MTASQATRVLVWTLGLGQELEPWVLSDVVHISAEGVLATTYSRVRQYVVTMQLIVPRDGVIAVAFAVAPDTQCLVALNGSLLQHGMHLLRHADRLDIDDNVVWVSRDSTPLFTRYTAVQHGAETRCSLTKARLRVGEEIVICPGVPGASCGLIYTRRAWEKVMAANPDMKCMRCGYRPGQPGWQPPVGKPKKELLDGLSQLTLHW